MAIETDAPVSEQAPARPLSLLASEEFGNKYYGEPKQAEQAAPLEAEETEVVEETNESEEAPVTESTPDEEYASYELSHIAQLVGLDDDQIDVDDDGRVVLSGKVNGESRRVNLKDLLGNFQMYEAADQRLEEAKSKAKTQSQELAKKHEDLQAQFGVVAELIKETESLLNRDDKAINWSELRQHDPAEYSAKKLEMDERKAQLAQMKSKGLAAYQQSKEKMQADEQANMQVYLQRESEALLEKLPEWKDPEKAKAGKTKLAEYLMSSGFSKEDVGAASDHRLIYLAHKAMRFDEIQKGTKAAEKKIAKVPKVLKPGAHQTLEQSQSSTLNKLQAQLRAAKSPTEQKRIGVQIMQAKRNLQ